MAYDDTELDPTKRPLQDNLGMGPVKVAAPSQAPMIGRPMSPTGVPMYNQGESVPATGTAASPNPHVQELNRLNSTGSGVSQVQKNHPFGGGVLRGLDVAASIAAPRIAQAIPGTTMHHNALVNQQEGLANQDVARGEREAQTQEIQQRPQMQQAVMEHQDELEAQKEQARQAQQAAAQQEQQSRLDEQLQQQQDTADQREEVADANRQTTEANADRRFQLHEKNADRRAASAGSAGTWQIAEDDKGQPMLYNSKTGETKAAPPNFRSKGTFNKTLAPAEDAKNYAVSYLQSGNFTGPGDEALQEKFFELAKPSTGFRMTQPQIQQLQSGRNWMNSVEGRLYHATHGTWFSDDQRKQIVDTMNQLAAAKQHPAQQPQQGGGLKITRDANGRIIGVE